jgi:hypothetical protein
MCPTNAELSTFHLRRTLYLKSREEHDQKQRARHIEQKQPVQAPLTCRSKSPGF